MDNAPPPNKPHRKLHHFLHVFRTVDLQRNKASEDIHAANSGGLVRSQSLGRLIIQSNKRKSRDSEHHMQLFHERLGLETLDIFKERNTHLLIGFGFNPKQANVLASKNIQIPSLHLLTIEILTNSDVCEEGMHLVLV